MGSAEMYEKRDAAFEEWLKEEQPRANPELQTVHRVAFNAGWMARKKEGDT